MALWLLTMELKSTPPPAIVPIFLSDKYLKNILWQIIPTTHIKTSPNVDNHG